jgi:uncharacterized protein (DUF608 family)
MSEDATRKEPAPPPPDSKCCEDPGGCGPEVNRRDFVRVLGLGLTALPAATAPGEAEGRRSGGSVSPPDSRLREVLDDPEWPSLVAYDEEHLSRIALPIGGIGTGTVSLGGRGDLRDWEIMNRPAKGFVPAAGGVAPFLALYARQGDGPGTCRLLEGPLDAHAFEGSHGSPVVTGNLPRFRQCAFAAAYPFGRVMLGDPDVPLDVHLKAFNPLVPADADASGIPLAVLTIELRNHTQDAVSAAVAMTLPNFIGMDGSQITTEWKGDLVPTGARRNRNEVREAGGLRGLFLSSEGVAADHPAWGTIALATAATHDVTTRTAWERPRWGVPLLDFWDDFSADGRLDDRPPAADLDMPIASLAASVEVPARAVRQIALLLAWHFPNRQTWTPENPSVPEDRIGNYYTMRYADAWDVLQREAPNVASLERRSARFVRTIAASALPPVVKEAALFNLSTLRTQTCFRTPDGRFYGFEGSNNRTGCCHGSCTHVWNYEQATAFLFGDLAWTMRDVEFAHATDDRGLMSFRVSLPLGRKPFGKAAADGQMGTLLKLYRDWQLSGRDEELRRLWPRARKALEFCWIPGGWDADRDGVMEGCQHNTMDVEYYGPNPQMGLWYLGALRAAEEMARHVGDDAFAQTCRTLFESGRAWIDAHLFNGEYYRHEVRAPRQASDIAPDLLVGMGAADPTSPEFQLADGCLIDQLVGQYMAHVCGLGYLVDPQIQPASGPPRALQQHAGLRARRGVGGADGRLSREPSGDPVSVLRGGDDRLRVHGRGRAAVRRNGGRGTRRHRARPCALRGTPPQPVRRSRVRPPLRPGDGELGGHPGADGLPLLGGHGHADACGSSGSIPLVHRPRLGRVHAESARWRCGTARARSRRRDAGPRRRAPDRARGSAAADATTSRPW